MCFKLSNLTIVLPLCSCAGRKLAYLIRTLPTKRWWSNWTSSADLQTFKLFVLIRYDTLMWFIKWLKTSFPSNLCNYVFLCFSLHVVPHAHPQHLSLFSIMSCTPNSSTTNHRQTFFRGDYQFRAHPSHSTPSLSLPTCPTLSAWAKRNVLKLKQAPLSSA